MRARRRCLLPLAAWIAALVLLCRRAGAANWAQVSGSTRHTNTAVVASTPWTRRHGHAAVALDLTDAEAARTGKKARLFVLAGDSGVQGSEDLRAYPGGGGFRNDVWATTGVGWQVENSPLRLNKWGDRFSQLVANSSWLQTNSGKAPPRGVTYGEWIACAAAAWAVSPPSGCDDPSQPPGAYLADSMFSPRRNLAAVAFEGELLVLGGRAREHVPVPELPQRGGASASELEAARAVGPRNARWREYAVLKNDVWRSSDAGASWSLVNAGCAAPQQALAHKGGRAELQCETSADCEGDATCAFDERAGAGQCVCSLWSPREFHAAVVHGGQLFVSGGYAAVERGNCGVEEHARKRAPGEEFACGGGVRAYMRDVWVSADGATWRELPVAGDWFSPRGEHAMVSFRSQLFVLAGRAAAAPGSGPDAQALLNDVWVSSSGGAWSQVTPAAPWAPRAKPLALAAPSNSSLGSSAPGVDKLLVLFGEDAERPLADAWAWTWPPGASAGVWTRDFGPESPVRGYVTAESSVRMLRIVPSEHAAALERVGVATVRELSALAAEQVVPLRYLPAASVARPLPSVDAIRESLVLGSAREQGMPVCDYVALAKLVVAQCSVAADEASEGEDEAADTAEADAEAEAAEAWDGCAHVGVQATSARTGRLFWPDVAGIDQVQRPRDVFADAQETLCRWQPRARAGLAGAVFQGRVVVLGGLVAPPDYLEHDVWYRDDVLPMAQLTLAPRDGSADTRFAFAADEPGCVFEYEVLDTREQLVVRNWTRVAGSTTSAVGSEGALDVGAWLAGGAFRLRVRALDPAGNADESFERGRNEHAWTYVPPLPWGLIVGCSAAALVLLAGFLMEWRKRRKRAAMERYAMKRMRRKLRGKKPAAAAAREVQEPRKKRKGGRKKDAASADAQWREAYDTAKDATASEQKKKKKAKAKKAKAGEKKTEKSKAGDEKAKRGDSKPKKKKKEKEEEKKKKTAKAVKEKTKTTKEKGEPKSKSKTKKEKKT